ncbi:hypothetical protein A2U01_0035955, partial [Trifolium medium]|nr:hypothetical protein [Trifolium medium]
YILVTDGFTTLQKNAAPMVFRKTEAGTDRGYLTRRPGFCCRYVGGFSRFADAGQRDRCGEINFCILELEFLSYL